MTATLLATNSAPAWYVYLIRTRDGSLYTGVSTDVARRLAEHRVGGRAGAKALRARGPLSVVYQQRIGGRGLALRAEHRLKRLSKSCKEALVRDQPDTGTLAALLSMGLP